MGGDNTFTAVMRPQSVFVPGVSFIRNMRKKKKRSISKMENIQKIVTGMVIVMSYEKYFR
jgi:hypothetical protein